MHDLMVAHHAENDINQELQQASIVDECNDAFVGNESNDAQTLCARKVSMN